MTVMLGYQSILVKCFSGDAPGIQERFCNGNAGDVIRLGLLWDLNVISHRVIAKLSVYQFFQALFVITCIAKMNGEMLFRRFIITEECFCICRGEWKANIAGING